LLWAVIVVAFFVVIGRGLWRLDFVVIGYGTSG
jgi:hypothetical protein